MLGMIHYSAIAYLHELVAARDYKMICIFEVFAQNRNEDDFLENLGILNDLRLQNEAAPQDGGEQAVEHEEGDAGPLCSDSGSDQQQQVKLQSQHMQA